jgi:uncharacterized membrane protein
MERMLAVVFDSEHKAYEASNALQSLDEDSVIALNVDAVVTRHHDGSTTIVKDHIEHLEGTMGGTALGTVIGALTGPFGAVIGALGGLAAGTISDLARARVDNDFIKEVATALEPGKSALVAQINEDDTDAVDNHMAALGGRVFRRAMLDQADRELTDISRDDRA